MWSLLLCSTAASAQKISRYLNFPTAAIFDSRRAEFSPREQGIATPATSENDENRERANEGGFEQLLDPTDFVSPLLDVSGYLSSNFGEMRANHFHSGVDFKTDGVEGKPVVAVADGYIARIHLQPGGYGRAIYIVHPNGTTSVYGHLQTFRADIEKYVQSERYRTKQQSVNLFLAPDKFPLKQGDEFAKSGNTGSSTGPHLHFEIRDTRTQKILNVVALGAIPTRDNLPPSIAALHYIEVDTVRGVPVHAKPRRVEVVATSAGRYRIKQQGALAVGGRGYFVLEVIDRKNDVANLYGVRRVSEWVGDQPVFEFRIDAFAFDQTRYCNAVACYPMQRGQRNEMIRLSQLSGCIDDFYPVMKNRALLTPAAGEVLPVRIEAEDDNGNISTLAFDVVGRESIPAVDPGAQIASNRTAFHHTQDGASVSIPAGMLYEPVFYRQSSHPAQLQTTTVVLSPVHSILDRTVPLHGAMTVSVHADVPEHLRPHATMGLVGGNKVSFIGGKYKNGAVSVNTRTAGDYCVVADTIAPKVTPKFDASKPVATRSITFAWSDNFSGIGSYTATLDGQWIALDRHPTSGTISHTFDDTRTPRGRSYALVLTLSDNCGNKRTWQGTIRR